MISDEVAMGIEIFRDVLFWCAILNYGVLLLWFLWFILARDSMHRLRRELFRMSADQFDTVHYAGMALYKIGILLFNLVPYIALRIVA